MLKLEDKAQDQAASGAYEDLFKEAPECCKIDFTEASVTEWVDRIVQCSN